MEPRILATTENWWVIDKPAGWLSIPPSQPSAAERPVISDWVRGLGQGDAFAVHRLDVETSGVLLLARTPEAHARANDWFAKHEVRKLYHFLASGSGLPEPTMRVNAPVRGKPATTLLESREKLGAKAFLGWARPLTGRRHQIRLHLSGLGRPILGDREYGGDPAFDRVALHAARLELPSGERFEAPWPADFDRWHRELKDGVGEQLR
jgi:23S rRNA-/tRNA-specific pseudouridylate synthase